MNIIEYLKQDCDGARLPFPGDRHLYWDNQTNEWVALYFPYRTRRPVPLYRGESEEKAVAAAMGE